MSTQPLPEISDAQKRKRSPHMVPWIVVGAIAVVALVASIVVINVVRGADQPEPKPTPTAEPTPTTSNSNSDSDSDTDGEEEPDDGVPNVDVGDTFPLNVSSWGITMQVSSRLGGDLSYVIEGENLIFSSSVINQLPESCAEMRSQWGVTRTGSGYEVLKPATRCSEAPELYDQIWGLTAAAAESAG